MQFQRSVGNRAVQGMVTRRQLGAAGQVISPDWRAHRQPVTTQIERAQTSSPRVQRAWYNFNIPFTNYQFDPSIEGIKTAAGVVKDTAVSAAEWIFHKIEGLVDDGIAWIKGMWGRIEASVKSAYNALKDSYNNILSLATKPLGLLADALMNFDGQTLKRAWDAFSGLINALSTGFKLAADGLLGGINAVWRGLDGFATGLLSRLDGLTDSVVFRHLPSTLQNIAYKAINGLKALWKTISDAWDSVFGKLKAWIDGAIDAVFRFVRKVAAFGIDVIVNGIVQFGRLILLLKDLFQNPGKYVNLLLDKSVHAFDGVAGFFPAQIEKYFGPVSAAPAMATASQAPGPAIHRAPAAGAGKRSANWSEIGHGVATMMREKWDAFLANPKSVLLNLLIDLVFPVIGDVKDVMQLFSDIKRIVTAPLSAGSLEELWTSLLQIAEIPILIYRTVTSILMRTLTLPLIVATFIPHPLVKAIAAAVGYGLLAAFVQGEGLNIAQKLLLLKTGATTQPQKEAAYNGIADSLVALAMTAAIILVMLILHFIASVLKGVFNFVKGKFISLEAPPAEAKGVTPTEADPSAKDVKGADPAEAPKDGLPSQDSQRRIRINEEGKCEICASPCDEIRKRYASVMTPDAEAKIKAIEDNAALNDAQRELALKPIEQELFNKYLNQVAAQMVGNVTAPIDFDGHITRGEIKPNGSVVGGHSTATGEVRVISGTESARNPQGVYKAKIEVADPSRPGQYLPKTNNGGFSTLFPDNWSPERIKVEVDAAYKNRTINGNMWSGTTPSGVKVQGYLTPKVTVYPVL